MTTTRARRSIRDALGCTLPLGALLAVMYSAMVMAAGVAAHMGTAEGAVPFAVAAICIYGSPSRWRVPTGVVSLITWVGLYLFLIYPLIVHG